MQTSNLTRDEKAELLHAQIAELRTYLRYCGLDSDELEEVLQEVLLAAWINFDSLRHIEKFPAWIRAIARRSVSRYRRATNLYRQRNFPLSLYEESLIQSGDPLPEGLVCYEIEKFSETDLYEMVMQLPGPAAEIIILHYVYDETFEAIARSRGMNPSTVRSIAKRSREKLKAQILERGDTKYGNG